MTGTPLPVQLPPLSSSRALLHFPRSFLRWRGFGLGFGDCWLDVQHRSQLFARLKLAVKPRYQAPLAIGRHILDQLGNPGSASDLHSNDVHGALTMQRFW